MNPQPSQRASTFPNPNWHVVLFIAIAHGWTWAWCGWLSAAGVTTSTGQGWPTHLPACLGPAFAAVVVTGLTDGARGLRRLGKECVRFGGWWALGVPMLVALGLLGGLLQHLTGHGPVNWWGIFRYAGAGAWAPPVVVLYALLINGFGEEIGWRGWLNRRWLDAGHSPLRVGLMTFPVWALWHMPFFWTTAGFRGMGAQLPGWLLALAATSIALAWIYHKTASVLLIAALHVSFNLAGATEFTSPFTTTLPVLAMLLFAGWVSLRSRHRDSPPRRG